MSHKPRKALGQHFLVDTAAISQIIDSAMVTPKAPVLEIGPGLGALTDELLARNVQLSVVELDRDLAARLRKRHQDRLYVYEQDVLQFDFTSLSKDSIIIGNLPYNISTPILLRLLHTARHVRHMVLMLQLEVVHRLIAKPHSKAYGRLSVLTQYVCEAHPIMALSPQAFDPPPKVESGVIYLRPHKASVWPSVALKSLEKVLATAFNQRRKTLANSLSTLFTPLQLQNLGIDSKLRAESLSIAEFIILAQAIDPRGQVVI